MQIAGGAALAHPGLWSHSGVTRWNAAEKERHGRRRLATWVWLERMSCKGSPCTSRVSDLNPELLYSSLQVTSFSVRAAVWPISLQTNKSWELYLELLFLKWFMSLFVIYHYLYVIKAAIMHYSSGLQEKKCSMWELMLSSTSSLKHLTRVLHLCRLCSELHILLILSLKSLSSNIYLVLSTQQWVYGIFSFGIIIVYNFGVT